MVAAALVLFAMFFGLTWAEHMAVSADGAVVGLINGPGTWSEAALLISAFTVLAAGPFRALESGGRRRAATAIAFVAALLVWSAPGRVLLEPVPGLGSLAELLFLRLEVTYLVWDVTLPFAAATALGTWVALRTLSGLRPAARRPALAAGVFAAGAVAVVSVWTRPGLPGEYASTATGDLGAAAFLTGAGMLLALVAAYVGSRSRPSAARRPSSD